MKTIRLETDGGEKEGCLVAYMEEWRHTYAVASTIARRIDSTSKKLAVLWFRVHQYRCDHTPKCKSFADFWKVCRDPMLREAKQRLLKGRKIHSVAFGQAWYKGFVNRKWAPEAYRQMALIPKALVSREGSLLLLRLYPRLELAFETNEQIDCDGEKAVRLVYRHTDKGKLPKGWSLLV